MSVEYNVGDRVRLKCNGEIYVVLGDGKGDTAGYYYTVRVENGHIQILHHVQIEPYTGFLTVTKPDPPKPDLTQRRYFYGEDIAPETGWATWSPEEGWKESAAPEGFGSGGQYRVDIAPEAVRAGDEIQVKITGSLKPHEIVSVCDDGCMARDVYTGVVSFVREGEFE